mmetsp:Transcript_44965/g.101179  ORF Transcript_44965/g.101179 Transcript_44965/m.101179 type:complete len:138 (-) Transcript_44965:58-471(-)
MTAMPKMNTVQLVLDKLRMLTSGLQNIVVTDRDGVVILQSPPDGLESPDTEQLLTTIFSMTTDHTDKIKALAKVKMVISTYSHVISIQANQGPLVIRLAAEPGTNIAVLTELLPQIQKVLTTVEAVIASETELDDME